MRGSNVLACTVVAMAIASIMFNPAAAQYWFQSGARGGSSSAFNNGASVSIETVYQNATAGSLGFWVGEDLSNGAFIQAGYEIPNQSGLYPASCDANGCNGSVSLVAGKPSWFWEYFPAAYQGGQFFGGIGPGDGIGPEGGFNTYSFNSTGDVWSAYFNNKFIGSVDLGASYSGANPPTAIAEYADTNTNSYPLRNVTFKDLMFYIGNESRLVPQAYSVVWYGKGSLTSLPNNYGVQEIGSYANYFRVGSGLPTQTSQDLWTLGYSLEAVSSYGNVTGGGYYVAYSSVPISATQYVAIGNGTREEFVGWKGSGTGSYTGNDSGVYIRMNGNITETAVWQRQYYLNATTEYGSINGTGWYDANTTAHVSVPSNFVPIGAGRRAEFTGWNSGALTNSTSIFMARPREIGATWERQYYLSLATPYGNATGSGWYVENATATASVTNTTIPTGKGGRIAFARWSNGAPERSISVRMSAPLNLTAIFMQQYLVSLRPQDPYGNPISQAGYFNVSGSRTYSGNIFVFANTTYDVEYINYKGVNVSVNYRFNASSPETLSFKMPVYNVAIYTQSVFGTPVNTIVNVSFKNRSSVYTYSGNDGKIIFNDVPYGYISGYAQYLGIKQSIDSTNGLNVYMTFFTASIIAFMAGGVLLILAVAKISARYARRRRR